MNSAGETSPVVGYFFLLLIFLPTIMYVIKELLILYIEMKQRSNTYNFVLENFEPKSCSVKVKKQKPTKQEFKTDEKIMEHARKALIGLGFKAKEAREVVQRLSMENCYLDEADLISDCFRKE